MKFNRILSSALVVIMMFSMIAVLITVEAKAAHHSSVSNTRLSTETVEGIINTYQKSSFANAEEMFQHDLAGDPKLGIDSYLDYVTNGEFTIYVNRYTGVMYYRHNATGEMLTSNSYNFNNTAGDILKDISSQIIVDYSTLSSKSDKLYSVESAAKLNQITVSNINGGLRVSYAIGETANRCLLPVQIEAHTFEDEILAPLFELLYDKMLENLNEDPNNTYALNYYDESGKYYNEEKVYSEKLLHTKSIMQFVNKDFPEVIGAYQQYVIENVEGGISIPIQMKINEVEAIKDAIVTIFTAYQPYNKVTADSFNPLQTPEIAHPDNGGYAVYKVKDTKYSQMATKAALIKNYLPDYTFDMMYAAEEFCKYEHPYESKPVFRCSLEYTFNEDGSLSVRLPANSIVFDETEYILKSITPLKYFGAVNFSNDGYVFLPDGSGSIIEFEDFRDSTVTMSSSLVLYGNDFCYSTVSGAHKQPLTMPVYGIAAINDKDGNRVGKGYFAILEEGASMAAINVTYKSKSFKEGSIYTTFTPYPTDLFDLSEALASGGSTTYTKVSESKYSGSYVTRYVMLSDNVKYGIGEGKKNYLATYVGMAEYYRQYLVNNGTLTALENVGNELPLYLEALGSLEVVEKILTFPVNISKPITTFEDIETIYDELCSAEEKMLAKADEYDALAEAEDDSLELKKYYKEKADDYRDLSVTFGKYIIDIENIDNINFKLTGFSNGGLHFTYPTRVKWERSLGGKRGFKELLEVAAEKTGEDSTFGIYPDFDFQYVNNTELFDGVGKRNTLSRMIDNRYASKQVYSSITGEFDTIYAMIVSADSLDRLYDKFIRKYDNYENATGISVSTLGSDLNSNFDEDNPVSRDEAQGYVTDLLDRISNESGYSVMTSQGNIYAVKYVDHILGVCTDSSYYRYSSYTIPFTGMILHGYVNYTGSALNYSGSPDYDLLRSIENGAALYYIIGYQNTDVMKDDEDLNSYYSVSYENWFDDIVEKYAIINSQLGDIQDYKIVNHEVLIGERVIDEKEQEDNLTALKNEFIENFKKQLELSIDAKLVELRTEGDSTKRIGVDADIDALVAKAHEMFELDDDEELPKEFREALVAVLVSYQNEYRTADGEYTGAGVDPNVKINTIDYESKYQYVTGSWALDENYDYTDYTVDNDLIVRVTYSNGEKTRSFILNYNIYSVEVTLEDGGEPIVIEPYRFERIDG